MFKETKKLIVCIKFIGDIEEIKKIMSVSVRDPSSIFPIIIT